MRKISVSIYTIYHILKKIIQRICGVRTSGVRGLVINKENKILLVKHTYLNGWHFPGGGVEKGESPRDAIIREVREEAGIIVNEFPVIIDCYYHKILGVDDFVCFYVIKKFDIQPFESPEIKEAKWFSLEDLPYDITRATRRRLAEFFEGCERQNKW
ncbi:NUDIX domain-containing protein [Fluviispira vulneris]|uniref:NUDIX domain-containing protein n=1 Tax=Fluviispira vulneris TaxID=2763012 RepID=UPI001647A48A|nr:NUDIX domain-containing protein [Fluviispira vulneris]